MGINAPIVVYTHTDVSDLWPMFFGELKSYMSDSNVYVAVNKKDDRLSEYNHIHYDDSKPYNERCKEILSQITEDVIIFLHEDPTIERPTKLKPALSTYERREMLTYLVKGSIVMTYNTESELEFLLKSIEPDVRFLGIDYLDSEFTGKDLNIPIHYISRQHGWSTTRFKQSIADEIQRSSNI
jgi:glycerol-3-phosphate cytidylyltransferase